MAELDTVIMVEAWHKKTTEETGRTSKIAACVLLAVNFTAMVFCILLFTFSLWTIASSRSLSLTIQAVGGTTLTALFPPESLSFQSGVGTAVVAIFMFFIAFMGFYGAVCRSQFLLFMYSTLVLLLLLLECALTYYFTSNLMEKGLQAQDGQWAHYTRLAFGCCDFNTSRFRDAQKPPWSCCGTAFYSDNCTIPDAFPQDCKQTIANWLDRYETAIYTSLAVLHIILSSCSLLRRSRSASRSLS